MLTELVGVMNAVKHIHTVYFPSVGLLGKGGYSSGHWGQVDTRFSSHCVNKENL